MQYKDNNEKNDLSMVDCIKREIQEHNTQKRTKKGVFLTYPTFLIPESFSLLFAIKCIYKMEEDQISFITAIYLPHT